MNIFYPYNLHFFFLDYSYLKKNQKEPTKNRMHLLLTRQLEDCSDLIVRFKELGLIVAHLPLLNIEKVQYNQKSLKGCNGIIFTSANAVSYTHLTLPTKRIV